MTMSFGQRQRRRRPDLTPMIDVVFLLLVFFMLASRFGAETGLPLQVAGAAAGYAGPPRLVDVDATVLRLNGVAVTEAALPKALLPLMTSPQDAVILRPAAGVDVQRLVRVMGVLRAAGLQRLVLVE
jgi:biopolymer transport protein ExbD